MNKQSITFHAADDINDWYKQFPNGVRSKLINSLLRRVKRIHAAMTDDEKIAAIGEIHHLVAYWQSGGRNTNWQSGARNTNDR